MAAYNSAPYIGASIQSVLAQTYRDFELIIIDDASTDATPDVISQFDDERIVALRNDTNLNSSGARNRALDIAQGKYIAIADGDDICLPQRLEKQVAYMESHPTIGVLGTQYRTINAHGKQTNRAFRLPLSHNQIVWGLFTDFPLSHTSVMIRASAFDAAGRHYHPSLPSAEDIDLWMRMLFVTRFANLDEVLIHYRDWSQSQSRASNATQRQGTMDIFAEVASKLMGRPIPRELRPHLSALYLKDHLLTESEASRAIGFLIDLLPALLAAQLLDDQALDDIRTSMIARIKDIARHSPQTMPLALGTIIILARVHSPMWLRRLWGRVKLFILARMP
jgi:glycosyltransferase involved in cell wall biosynthesis